MRALIAASLLVALLAPRARAQCAKQGALPVDPRVIGARMRTPGCRRGDLHVASELRVHAWGIFWQPTFAFHAGREQTGVCPEEIVVLFRKGDRPAELLHRPLTGAGFFRKSHPKLYRDWAEGRAPAFPCKMVKAMPVRAWGSTRGRFRRLVAKMASEIRRDRGRSCAEVEMNGRGREGFVLVEEVRKMLKRHEVASNAVAYLHTLAYVNFFCV